MAFTGKRPFTSIEKSKYRINTGIFFQKKPVFSIRINTPKKALMTLPPPVTLVIVDDSAIFRDGVKTMLRRCKNQVQVIGEASNGKEALEVINMEKPDIVLLDIQMAVMDGIETCVILKEQFPLMGIIALSTFNEQNVVLEMAEAGADGYLLKTTTSAEVLKAINEVYEGKRFFSSEVTGHLANIINENNSYRSKKAKSKLSEREKDIVRLMCLGDCNKEIASKLGLTKRTVESYREKIIDKLGARNSMDAVVHAIKNKIFKI